MCRLDQRDERGATAILVSVLMALVLMVSAAFAVDLGQQRVLRSDLQAVADVAALDLARELDGDATAAQLELDEQRLAELSRDRNRDVLGFGDHRPVMTVDWGEVTDGEFVESAPEQVPTAVRVTASSAVDFAFAGVSDVGSGQASGSAVATADQSACFRIGSFVAGLDSAESALLNPVLNALLGTDLSVGAVGYQGLANARVTLAELVELGGLDVGTVDALLGLENLRTADLLEAMATVLERQQSGAPNNAEVALLRTIAAGIDANTPTIAIADLIDVEGGSEAALTAGLNVLDLVTGAAYAVAPAHAVAVEGLAITLPDDLSGAAASTELTVIELPRLSCGPAGTTNDSAQIRLDTTVTVPALELPVAVTSLIGTDLEVAPTTITLSVDLGQAVAELTGVRCNASGPDLMSLRLGSSVLGATNLAASADMTANVRIPLVDQAGGLIDLVSSLVGIDLLDLLGLTPRRAPYVVVDAPLNLRAAVPAPATYSDKSVEIPLPSGYDVPTGGGDGPVMGPVETSLGSSRPSLVLHYYDNGVLGAGAGWREQTLIETQDLFSEVLDPLADALASALNPLVETIQSRLITPMSDLLGVQLGGADVFAVREPTCKEPRLRG